MRCFTESKRVAAGDGPNRLDRLAGRFAAKDNGPSAGARAEAGGGFLDTTQRKEPTLARSALTRLRLFWITAFGIATPYP